MRCTTAEPTTTPSDTCETSTACSGADTDADEYRLVGDVLQTPGDLDRRCRKGGANTGDTEQTDAIDEASRPLDNQGQPFVGRVGAASMTVSTPASSAADAHSPTSSRGMSGRMHPDTPAAASEFANRSKPMW